MRPSEVPVKRRQSVRTKRALPRTARPLAAFRTLRGSRGEQGGIGHDLVGCTAGGLRGFIASQRQCWTKPRLPDEVNYHPEVVEPQIDDCSGRIVYRRTEFDPVHVSQARSDLDIAPSPVLLRELGDPGTRMAVSNDTHMNFL